MKKSFIVITVIFYILGFSNLVFFYTGLKLYQYISVSTLMPLLALYYIIVRKKISNKQDVFILLSLFFAWIGDVTMMFLPIQPIMLIPGLVSFLFTHILYIKIFSKGSMSELLKGGKLIATLLLIVYGIILYVMLFSKLEAGMRIPVFIYDAAITLGIVAAISRYKKVNAKSFYLVLLGAVLFLISDSTLSINRFLYPFYWHYLPTMAPYFSGQYFIIIGLLFEKE